MAGRQLLACCSTEACIVEVASWVIWGMTWRMGWHSDCHRLLCVLTCGGLECQLRRLQHFCIIAKHGAVLVPPHGAEHYNSSAQHAVLASAAAAAAAAVSRSHGSSCA